MPERRHAFELRILGERLRARRQALDLRQREVAERTGITQSQLSKVEKSGGSLDLFDLRKLLETYELTFDELLRDFTTLEKQALQEARRLKAETDEDLRQQEAQRQAARAAAERSRRR